MARSDFRPSEVPSKPGVYVYRDRFGEVIYVGKAANLRRRVSQYFHPSRFQTADPKLRSLINSIDTWEFFTVRSEDESLILESRFIKEYAPRYNILLRDDKRYPFLRIDRAEKFPRLKFARFKRNDGSIYYGPFPRGSALRAMMEYLTRKFGLRCCKAAEPGEEEYKHCLAGTVRDCSCPCAGFITEDDYNKRLDAVIDVLNGHVHSLLEELKTEMSAAAEKQHYEKAASLRDVMDNLKSLCGGGNRTFEHAQIPADAGMTAVRDLQQVLHLKNPPQIIEGFDISNISGTLAVASLVHFKNGHPAKDGYRRFRIRTVEGSNDFAMMKEAVTRHFSRLMREHRKLPDLLLVDGGKGQLSSAIDALVSVDCPPFPVIGLAKKNEEIFLPGCPDPIVLGRERPALKVLQALRDEAHRFAITFHRELRMKKLTESLLDEIEGLGEHRKTALLREFGSVSELRNAAPSDIAARVPGIGPVFAEKVSAFLAARLKSNNREKESREESGTDHPENPGTLPDTL